MPTTSLGLGCRRKIRPQGFQSGRSNPRQDRAKAQAENVYFIEPEDGRLRALGNGAVRRRT